MSVKDILVAAFNKDATSFETAFSSVMKEKVSAAVENKFFAAEEYELDESKDEDEEDEDEEDEDEEDELEEKKLTAKDVKHALASAKAKPKETVSLKKPPFKMEEVELDEVSSKLLRRAAKAADYNHQAQIDMQKEYEPNRKTPAPSVQAAGARAMKFRVAALKKDYTKKEEVNSNEASE